MWKRHQTASVYKAVCYFVLPQEQEIRGLDLPFPRAGLNLHEHLGTWIKGINWKTKSSPQDCRWEKPKLSQRPGAVGKGGFCLPPFAGGGAGNRILPELISVLWQVTQKQCTNSAVLTVGYLENIISLLSSKVYQVFRQSCHELNILLEWVGFAALSSAAPSPRNSAEPLSAQLSFISLQFTQKILQMAWIISNLVH